MMALALAPLAGAFNGAVRRRQMVRPLRAADDAAAPAPDPFDSFVFGSQTQPLAVRDGTVGTGEAAAEGDVVTVKYTGRLLLSGAQFDAGTISFKLGAGRVIPGWEQGLLGGGSGAGPLRVGGSRVLRIPSSLGYGAAGAGGDIPPNADLEFDVELVSVASGPVAELVAQLGLGLNTRTALIALLGLTFVPGLIPQ